MLIQRKIIIWFEFWPLKKKQQWQYKQKTNKREKQEKCTKIKQSVIHTISIHPHRLCSVWNTFAQIYTSLSLEDMSRWGEGLHLGWPQYNILYSLLSHKTASIVHASFITTTSKDLDWKRSSGWLHGDDLRRTVVTDWRFDNLCRNHLQSTDYYQRITLESWFTN